MGECTISKGENKLKKRKIGDAGYPTQMRGKGNTLEEEQGRCYMIAGQQAQIQAVQIGSGGQKTTRR